MRNLIIRGLSGIILIALVALLSIYRGWPLVLGVIVLSLVASKELHCALNKIGYKYPVGIVFVFAIIFNIINYIEPKISLGIFLLFFLVGLTMANVFNLMDTQGFLAMLFASVYIVVIFSLFINFNHISYFILAFACAWGSDTFAYIFGILLGKHKLCERISPKKTIEGSVGGIIGSAVLVGLAFNYFGYNNIVVWVLIGALGSVIGQIGDLVASYIKRKADIKDFGNLIKGHGGILDRFDSILFVLPYIYVISLL